LVPRAQDIPNFVLGTIYHEFAELCYRTSGSAARFLDVVA